MFSVNNKFNIFIFIAFSVCTDIGLAAVVKDLESIDINNAEDRVDKDMMEMEGRAGPVDLIQGIVDLFTSILSSNPLITAETTTMSYVDIVDSNESSTSNNEASNGPTDGGDKEAGEEQKENDRESCPPS